MEKKSFIQKVLEKLEYRPLQIYLSHYRSAEMDLSAIAVAYYLLLTAFPLVIIAANIFPYLSIDTTDFLLFLKDNLPTSIYRPVSVITADIFSKPSKSILGVATVTAIWTMSRSLTSLQKALNKAYGVSQHRDFFVGRLVGIAMSFLLFFLLTFVLIFTTLSKPFLQLLIRKYELNDTLTGLLLNLSQPVTALTIFLGVFTIYFFLPNVKIKKFRYLLPGTALVTIVMVFFSNLVSNYILTRIQRLVDIKIFGSIVIFILMIWFIFLAYLIIFGSIIDATYQELKEGDIENRRGDIISLIQARKTDSKSS